MSLFKPESGPDTVYIERDGKRSEPYRCIFSAPNLTLFYKELDIKDGDKLYRTRPGGEDRYTVNQVQYVQPPPQMRNIPVHYKLEITKDSAVRRDSTKTTTNHINIHSSQGIQIGDHNVQNLQLALQEVLTSIDNSGASHAEKEDARNKLAAFLAHPLVAAAVGSAISVGLGLIS